MSEEREVKGKKREVEEKRRVMIDREEEGEGQDQGG